VREIAGYKNQKGKSLVKTASLIEVCKKNSSDAFLDCVSGSQNLAACTHKGGSSNRLPASHRIE